MAPSRLYVDALLDAKAEAVPDEVPTLVGSQPLLVHWKINHAGLEHNALIENPHLAHLIAEGFLPKEHFVVDYSDGPNIDLSGDHCLLIGDKALGRQVPICANSLGGQLEHLVFGGFAQAEIGDLDSALVEQDVLRLEVIVDDLVAQLMQVPDCADDLPND